MGICAIGDTRPLHGRRWYYCTWPSADTRRAPAARRVVSQPSFHSTETFYARYISRSPAVDWNGGVPLPATCCHRSLPSCHRLPSSSSCKIFSTSKWEPAFLHDD